MNYHYLEIENRQGVGHIWINRPDVHNAFNEVLIAELQEAFGAAEQDEGIRIVVLGGRGKSFCAGADLEWMAKAAGYSASENLRDARALAAMLQALDRLSKPTIARVHGAALGGGTGLVAACDIAVASESAVFGTTEVRYGLIPATIGPYVLGAIGQRAARRYFLSAERFPAAEAHAIGLVHEVCPADLIDQRLTLLTQALLAGGPQAQASAKALVRTLGGMRADDGLPEHTARAIAQLRATPEAKEGIAAFLEKRKPQWFPGTENTR
jgi:methylglutaconyl-CoA hydratase